MLSLTLTPTLTLSLTLPLTLIQGSVGMLTSGIDARYHNITVNEILRDNVVGGSTNLSTTTKVYTHFNGHSYWSDAASTCALWGGDGGQLALPRNVHENRLALAAMSHNEVNCMFKYGGCLAEKCHYSLP